MEENYLQNKLVADIKKEFGWGDQNAVSAVRANFCCEYCDTNLLDTLNSYDSWQIDHITPKRHERNENLDNLALSCRTCNHLKHDYVPAGTTRTQRVNDAREYVSNKRKIKENELMRLRGIIKESGIR